MVNALPLLIYAGSVHFFLYLDPRAGCRPRAQPGMLGDPCPSIRAHTFPQRGGIYSHGRPAMACAGRLAHPLRRAGITLKNGNCESFNGELRDELLKGVIFHTLKEAHILIKRWSDRYNTLRRHGVAGYFPTAPEAILPRPAGQPPRCVRASPAGDHSRRSFSLSGDPTAGQATTSQHQQRHAKGMLWSIVSLAGPVSKCRC